MRQRRTETFRVPVEKLWPLLADTDGLNREIGLPPVEYTFVPLRRGGAAIRAKARANGIALEWDEEPYEWTWPRAFSVRRAFRRGPFKTFHCTWSLEPAADGATAMTVDLEVEPSGLTGKLLTGTLVKRGVGQIFDAARGYEKFLRNEATTPFPNRQPRIHVNRDALDAALQKLKKFPVVPGVADRLASRVAGEVDERVRDLRPFQLADEWGAGRFDVLKACLYATRAGLLDLRWHVICPRCRGSKGEHDTLKKLAATHECPSCAIQFQLDLDRRIEARFVPNRAIRAVGGEMWCMGGPMNTPHIYAQFQLAPGEERKAVLGLPAGRYQVRRPDRAETTPLAIGAGPASAALEIGEGPVPAAELASGGTLALRNRLDAPMRIAVELEPQENAAATAAAVTSLQEFRDLYATEALAPGLELTIGSLAVFFSDLKGSTQMYDKIGDAPAYAVVRKHFDFMMGHIRAANGAVVKTMGDAVMAVFRDPADAVRCALSIQQAAAEEAASIKIGLHYGSCLAVTSVDYLDYFGSTVNVAQRAQGQSAGADVVVTDEVFRDPRVAEVIRAKGAHESSFTASLKGLEGRFVLHRLVFGNPGETFVRKA